MKTISISIPRESVFQRVARQMDWEGTRGESGDSQYSRLAISESDRSLLHSFFDEAAMHAIDLCRPMLKSIANTDESLTLTLALSDDADSAVSATLRPILFNMLTAKVLVQWQEIVSPEKAEQTERRRADSESKFQAAIYHHPAPVRKR